MFILELFIASLILWVFFIVFSNTKKYTDRKYNPVIQAFAHLFSVILGIGNIIFNHTYAPIVFWFVRPPWALNALMLTSRLKYILQAEPENSWRWKLAYFVCRRLIEPWDYNHCALGK